MQDSISRLHANNAFRMDKLKIANCLVLKPYASKKFLDLFPCFWAQLLKLGQLYFVTRNVVGAGEGVDRRSG